LNVESARRPRRRLLAPSFSWERYEWQVLGLALVLVAVGLLLLRSMAEVDDLFERPGAGFGGQIQKLAVTLPMLVVGLVVPARWLKRRAWTIYVLTLLGLVAVMLIGEERNNARRWIATPVGFDLQPSEFAKLGLILVLARVLGARRPERWRDWARVALLTLVPMALVARQPDLGTALTLVPVAFGMLYLAGGSGRWISILALSALGVGWLAWEHRWVQDYQLRRIDTWAASLEAGALIEGKDGPAFHVYHARVAIGNGGLGGTGLGQGVTSTGAYLPERESDSIFCVLAEEAGLVGATAFLALYALMIGLLLRAAGRVRERTTRLIVGGVALYFGAHFFVNVGVNLGLVPMTGLPLPWLSTGGSSLLVSFLALGLALGLVAQEEPSLDQGAFRDH
jgi:rod shape determining protein RodA